MNCPICNKEINDNAKFCKFCGNKIEAVTEVPVEVPEEKPEFVECPNCGQMMGAYKTFCTNCGTSLQQKNEKVIEEPKKEVEEPKKKTKKKGLIIALISACILLIGSLAVATVFFMKDDRRDKKIEHDEDDDKDDDREDRDEKDDEDESEDIKSDVEDDVLEIREKYDSIVSAMTDNEYDKSIIEDGFVAYSDADELKSMVVSREYTYSDYDCFYYYDDEKLIFAYYEGEDAHRFYFKDEELIRWRYSEDASEPEDAVNHDMDDSDEYLDWESAVLDEAQMLEREWSLFDGDERESEYILPDSDSRIITEDELDELSQEEVKLARNEIYARHGRKFDDESLQRYFLQFDWYNPTIDPDDFEESMLNEYEVVNRDFIIDYEIEKGYR